ncbi:hypothetical protein OCH239_12700 [Roseivivax halodurans JCM 10272]|uniref:Sulfotransferase family protein n=1 Tax=Roseivivax halodurans JCM 10272 TaxID=1449350 RepID=X7EDF1_9RHOB|nr:sulfotransferase family 2 domain-containing protein [Roseivivax halodurans]ETX13231.1 hypothetical protein OCH239_12700 [Roseivivax halodurans JCM 10272]
MPLFKAADRLVYYAHVPKCGGSAIAYYLIDRFGPLGFYDSFYHDRPDETPWTRTSPQHVDVRALETLLPARFFDAMFAVVRHPVPRTVSTYHFQREVEKRIPDETSFSEWLKGLEDKGTPRFEYDNHVLPMDQLVPEGATIFHLEHGLDGLVHWCDLLTGRKDGPRAVTPENARGMLVDVKSEKAIPTEEDIARIGRIYDADFERFGYTLDRRDPSTPPPELTEAFLAERDRALDTMQRPVFRLKRWIRRRLQRV